METDCSTIELIDMLLEGKGTFIVCLCVGDACGCGVCMLCACVGCVLVHM